MNKLEISEFMKQFTNAEIGGFGGFFDISRLKNVYENPVLVASCDGVGTKLDLAVKYNKLDTIGIDLVAMNVNDIVCHGAKPLFFMDYIAIPWLNKKQLYDIMIGIQTGCNIAGCRLIGGETAFMNSHELAGFAVGVVDKVKKLPTGDIKAGDVVLGLKSSGIHANGFSLLPQEFKDAHHQDLLKPTEIYVYKCLNLKNIYPIKAFAHVTGGGIQENIRRVLPEHLSWDIKSYDISGIFFDILHETGVPMKNFNCGFGMLMIVDSQYEERIIQNHNAEIVGVVTNG